MRINLNDTVKVKLTTYGIQVLAKQHKELREYILIARGKDIGEFVLKLDSEGYYSIQLWSLMDKFKEHIGLGRGNVIEKNELILKDITNSRR